MSTGYGRLYSYTPNQYIRKNQVEGEFDNLLELINLPPAHPWRWTHFVGDDTFMTANTKFPQWITPEPNWLTPVTSVVHLTHLLSYYRTRQDTTSTDGGYSIGIYVNEVLVRTVWLYTSSLSMGTASITSIGAKLDLEPGDVVRLSVESVIDNGNKWKNVTLVLSGSGDWWMSSLALPATRILTPLGNSIVGTDWDNEFDNNVTFLNDAYFSYSHSVFIAGEPTTASKGAIFRVPTFWENTQLRRAIVVFHGGTESDSLSIDFLNNISVNLGTLTLAVTDLADVPVELLINAGLNAGDTVEFDITDDSGIQEDVTITLEFQFQPQGAYTKNIAAFTAPYLSSEWKQEIDAELAYVEAESLLFDFPAYYESPSTPQDRNVAFIVRGLQGAQVSALYGIFRGGTASGTTTITAKRNGTSIGNIKFENAGDPIDTIKTNDIADVTLSDGDLILWDMTNHTGDQEQITVWLEVSAQPQPGG